MELSVSTNYKLGPDSEKHTLNTCKFPLKSVQFLHALTSPIYPNHQSSAGLEGGDLQVQPVQNRQLISRFIYPNHQHSGMAEYAI